MVIVAAMSKTLQLFVPNQKTYDFVTCAAKKTFVFLACLFFCIFFFVMQSPNDSRLPLITSEDHTIDNHFIRKKKKIRYSHDSSFSWHYIHHSFTIQAVLCGLYRQYYVISINFYFVLHNLLFIDVFYSTIKCKKTWMISHSHSIQ